MPITNTSIKSLGSYTIDEINSFNPDQTQNVPMDRQFTPVTNITKVSHAVTWGTWNVPWGQETRTWRELSSLVDNTSHKNLGSYSISEANAFSPDQIGTTSFSRQFSPITNTSKPS